jgi:hypothetical protein
MSSLFFIGGDRADPMPGKNERQGRSTNIFFFHEGSLQGHRLWASTRTIGDVLASLDGVIVYELPIELLRTLKPLISQIFC